MISRALRMALRLTAAGGLLAVVGIAGLRAAGAEDPVAVHRAEAAAGGQGSVSAERLAAGKKVFEAACMARWWSTARDSIPSCRR